MRMSYQEIIVQEPQVSRVVRFSPYNFADPNRLHMEKFVTTPAFVRDYRVRTPSKKGPRSKWKPFRIYKRFESSIPRGYQFSLFDNSTWSPDPFSMKSDEIQTDTTPLIDPSKFGPRGNPFLGLSEFHELTDGELVIPAPDNLESLHQLAMSKMMPLIKSELSLINSVIELKDATSLVKSIQGALKAILLNKSLSRNGRTLSNMYRSGADGYLQAKFNILPFLSDISGLQAALSRTEKRINDLVARSGRTQRKHFAFHWAEYINVSDQSSVYNILVEARPTFLTRQVIHEPTTFHSEIEYNFNYAQYDVVHARLLATLDALGVRPDPSIIWNAIPFSFIVDWVFGVSRFLEQFGGFNMEPKINIHRYLWSVKRSRRCQWAVILDSRTVSPWSWPGTYSMQLPATHETAYRRDITMPSLSSIVSSGVSLQELTLGAALVTSKRRHRTSRRH